MTAATAEQKTGWIYPLFNGEGPEYYQAAYAHNSPWAVPTSQTNPGPWQTRLSPSQEASFSAWVIAQSIPFDPSAAQVDYDMRGFWLANPLFVYTPGSHFPDTYKTPYDTTFSKESMYAKPGTPFEWNGNRLMDTRDGSLVFGPAIWRQPPPPPKPPTIIDESRISASQHYGAPQLQASKLDKSGMNALGTDIDVQSINLARKGAISLRLIERITAADVERTVEGASTLTITFNDQDKQVLKSGYLREETDCELDGLWFRLVKVRKNDDDITLTFEDREINVMRQYTDPRAAQFGTVTRSRFAEQLVQEVREFSIPFVAADLSPKDKVTSDQQPYRPPQPTLGFQPGVNITIKGVKADHDQLSNIGQVLDTGLAMGVSRKVLVCSMMTVIQESSAYNLHCVTRWNRCPDGPIGMFQQFHSMDWPASRDILVDAEAFFRAAETADHTNPNLPYYELCELVQISGKGHAYAQWRTEAERIVFAYGISPRPGATGPSKDVQNQFNQDPLALGSDQTQYEFTRGSPQNTKQGVVKWKREDTWLALQRLADEVNWRCFMVSGTCYFVPETWLFQYKPTMTISEETPGVDRINADYDTGKRTASVTVTARVGRWDAPPGSTVELQDMGPMDGRWLVAAVKRSIFDSTASITLKKPRAKLPEPKAADGSVVGGGTKPPNNHDPAAGSSAANLPYRPGKFVHPCPNGVPASFERTDMGWDFMTGPSYVGQHLLAVGNGRIGAIRSAGDFGPNYIVLLLDDPVDPLKFSEHVDSRAGRAVYYGHCGRPLVNVGDPVPVGKPITTIAGLVPSLGPLGIPGHVEMGWADPTDTGHYTMLAISSGSCPQGRDCNTPEGRTFYHWCSGLPRFGKVYNP